MSRDCFTAPRDYYVDIVSGNDSNSGATAGSAWATAQHAYDTAQRCFDLCAYPMITHISGSGISSVTANGPLVGQGAPEAFTFLGNAGAPWLVTLNTTALQPVFAANYGARYKIQGMMVKASAPNASSLMSVFGHLQFGDMFFDAAAVHGYAVGSGSKTQAVGPITFQHTANCNTAFLSEAGAWIGLGVPIAMAGAPNFSNAFAQADLGGQIDATGAVILPGSASGRRFNAISNGVINTGGGGANFFPGNSAGYVGSGGYYQ